MNDAGSSAEGKWSTWILGLGVVVALLVRLGWGLTRPGDDAALAALPDQREYLEVGRNLLHGEGLKFIDARFGQEVWAYRTPGYPLFIALCGGNARAVRVVQAAIDSATVIAAYLLARRWLGRGASVVAAGIVALNPFLVYFSGLVLSETLFTAMLAWGMVLLVRQKGKWWVTGGVLLALAVLVRPGAVALPVVLGLLAALVNRRAEGAYQTRWPAPVGLTMLLITLLALLPWALRNYRVLGRWVWTSTNSGITSYDGFNPDATGASDQSFVARMPQLVHMSETERSEYLSERAKDFVWRHPGQAMELTGVKVARTWSPRPLSSEFSRPIYVAAAWLYCVPVWLAALAGLWYGTISRMAKVFLLAPAIYLTIGAALSVGSLRYRVPAEVPLAVLAASFARFAWERETAFRRAEE